MSLDLAPTLIVSNSYKLDNVEINFWLLFCGRKGGRSAKI